MPENRDQGIGLNGCEKRNRCRVHDAANEKIGLNATTNENFSYAAAAEHVAVRVHRHRALTKG